jgi:hypothetical protein
VTPTAESPPIGSNQFWHLKSFMDSLIVELDRAQDVLAVKGLSRPVTYTVKDVDVDLRCFPVFDGRKVRFVTAKPGEDGSSTLRFSLGSISASTIRDSTPSPTAAGDVSIEDFEELEPDAKEALAAVGVRSGRDIKRIVDHGVDLGSVTENRAPDYSDLAAMITKAQRRRLPPRVAFAQLSTEGRKLVLRVEGENLAMASSGGFPYALLNGRARRIRHADAQRVVLEIPGFRPAAEPARLTLALDPLTVVTMELSK